MTEASVRPILYVSQQNNRRRDVTGCLMFSGQHFAQTLEGDPGILAELARKIAADPRHPEVVVLVDRETDIRLYQDWSMGLIYNLELADRLEALLQGTGSRVEDAVALMESIRPDSVMGALT